MKLFRSISVCLLLAACLIACSSQVQQISLTPELSSTQTTATPLSVQLNTKDLRNNQFLISIHHEGKEQARLISSARNIRAQVNEQLNQAMASKGFLLEADSPNLFKVDIVELVNRVEQGSVSYKAESSMRLKLTIDTPRKTFVKQYRSLTTNEGPFNVDPDKQATMMSQQLSALLLEVIDDPQVIDILEQ